MNQGGSKLLLIGIAAIVAYTQLGGLGIVLVGAALLLMSR